jgi:hypothetical protein
MWKVLQPLPGYGYCVGDIADVIQEEDVPKFLKNQAIQPIEVAPAAPAPNPEKPKKKSGK